MHLAGEMGIGVCWGVAHRAVLLEISLNQSSRDTDLQQAAFISGQRILCCWYPIP